MHNTRLFISLDGPHQGANVPLSLQLAYRHAMNIFGKYIGSGLKLVSQAFNLFLDGQAAQQLLIYHLDTQSGTGQFKPTATTRTGSALWDKCRKWAVIHNSPKWY